MSTNLTQMGKKNFGTGSIGVQRDTWYLQYFVFAQLQNVFAQNFPKKLQMESVFDILNLALNHKRCTHERTIQLGKDNKENRPIRQR